MTRGNCSGWFALTFGALTLSLTPALPAAPFTPGNIVVERVGDGVVDIGDLFDLDRLDALPAYLDEYTPAGALVQTIALPSAVNGNQRRLTESGGTAGDGKITRTTNGAYLLVPGYDAALGTDNVVQSAAADVNRTIARVSWDGTIDTSTSLTDAFDGKQFRSVTSNDGSQFWMVGQDDSIFGTGGFRYVANLGDTTSVTMNSGLLPNNNNNQGVHVFDNGGTEQLYIMSRANFPGRGVHQVGTGLPTSATGTSLLTPALTGDADNLFAFTMLDLDNSIAGLDTIYAVNNDEDAGLWKFTLNNMGEWVSSGHVNNGEDYDTNEREMEAITAKRVGNDVVLYVLTGETESNRLQTYTDTTGYGGVINGSVSFTTLTTAADNYIFRGVAFTPEDPAAAVPGDADGDGDVDLDDYNIMSGNMYTAVAGGYADGDFDEDGDVDFEDFVIQALNFGDWPAAEEAVANLPEPGMSALLCLGVLSVLRRPNCRHPGQR